MMILFLFMLITYFFLTWDVTTLSSPLQLNRKKRKEEPFVCVYVAQKWCFTHRTRVSEEERKEVPLLRFFTQSYPQVVCVQIRSSTDSKMHHYFTNYT